jgi:nucleoside-diphosphate-sugar epimerase
MIHREDVVGLIHATLERGSPGRIYNGVDHEPVSQSAFFAWLAAALNRPEPPRIAGDLQMLSKRGVTNKRVSNTRVVGELGYEFRYPTFREGYAAEVKQALAS